MTEFEFKTIDKVENRSYFLLIGIYEYNYLRLRLTLYSRQCFYSTAATNSKVDNNKGKIIINHDTKKWVVKRGSRLSAFQDCPQDVWILDETLSGVVYHKASQMKHTGKY